MKASTVIAVAAGVYTVSAQLDAIPPCALSCAIGSLGSTGCPTTDIACICNASAFVSGLIPCVQDACDASQFDATVQAATTLCQSAGVTLQIPSGGSSSSSSEVATTTVASSTATVSVPVYTSTETTMSTTVAVNTTTSSGPVPTGGNSTMTGPPVPSGTDDSAAGRNAVAFGGLGAIVAVIAALL